MPIATADISWAGLAWTVLLILATLLASRWQKLGLEQRLLLGCVRTTVQLALIGYVLRWIIHGQNLGVILLTIAVQLSLAAWTVGSLQSPALPGSRLIALISLGPAYVLVITVLLALVVRPEPWYNPRVMLTLGGMLLGNSMTGVALVLNRFRADVQSHRDVVLARAALGASWREAVADERRAAAHAALLPTISGLLTVGLVSLPGMMTGQIIAGADPLQAVKYQIVVMFMIAAVVAVATFIALELITRRGKFEAHRVR
jgi:putative ABC transport system permease protein